MLFSDHDFTKSLIGTGKHVVFDGAIYVNWWGREYIFEAMSDRAGSFSRLTLNRPGFQNLVWPGVGGFSPPSVTSLFEGQ